MTTGSRIKQMRMQRNLSQREFAQKLGYTDHSIITRIESGQVDLPLSKLRKIAEVLDAPIPWLMCMDEEPAPQPKKDEVAELLAGASEATKQNVIQYIKFIRSLE